MENGRTDEHGWIKPLDIVGYEVAIWAAHYGMDHADYTRHYKLARLGNMDSIELMQWLADTVALKHMRGNWDER